jgi:glycosyltransferase involved in cell wall biosynthesis
MKPRVCIGMIAYNDEAYIDQAVQSLQGQTHGDFRLLISDDCSTDRTLDIIQSRARRDQRIIWRRNRRRLGLAGNSRLVFSLCRAEADYFAWAAGHDIHRPGWLAAMLAALEGRPEAVLAYPLTERISARGDPLEAPSPRFDTQGLTAEQRIQALYEHGRGFGHMVYGLFRAQALRRVGEFPAALAPDVLLLWEAALAGVFIQTPEKLWARRFFEPYDYGRIMTRQRRTVFGAPPWHAYLPWPLPNSARLLWRAALRPGLGGWRRRRLGLRLAGLFLKRYLPKVGDDASPLGRLIARAIRR